jgi:hypothetical protein
MAPWISCAFAFRSIPIQIQSESEADRRTEQNLILRKYGPEKMTFGQVYTWIGLSKKIKKWKKITVPAPAHVHVQMSTHSSISFVRKNILMLQK